MLLLYAESLGFMTVAEVLALTPDVSEGGASKRARTAEGNDPLDFFRSSLNEEITGSDVTRLPQLLLPAALEADVLQYDQVIFEA